MNSIGSKFFHHIFFALAILLAGCSKSTSSTPTREELLLAPEQVEIKGLNYTLSAYLWRDFMPVVNGAEGGNLIALITVSEKDAREIPSNIDADTL